MTTFGTIAKGLTTAALLALALIVSQPANAGIPLSAQWNEITLSADPPASVKSIDEEFKELLNAINISEGGYLDFLEAYKSQQASKQLQQYQAWDDDKISPDEQPKMFLRAIDGDNEIAYRLGSWSMRRNHGVPGARNAFDAMGSFKTAADRGDVRCQLEYNWIRLFFGEQDDGLKYLERSAADGNAKAHLYLARHKLGRPDRETAKAEILRHLSFAAKAGMGEAYFLIGKVFDSGMLGTVDKKRSFACYLTSDILGYFPATVPLGMNLLQGLPSADPSNPTAGRPINAIGALIWFKAASRVGDQEGQYYYATNVLTVSGYRIPFLQKTFCSASEAIDILKDLATGGWLPAYAEVGNCYETGKGCVKDLEAAGYWYKEGVRLKSPDSMVRHFCLRYGDNLHLTEHDRTEAAPLLNEALQLFLLNPAGNYGSNADWIARVLILLRQSWDGPEILNWQKYAVQLGYNPARWLLYINYMNRGDYALACSNLQAYKFNKIGPLSQEDENNLAALSRGMSPEEVSRLEAERRAAEYQREAEEQAKKNYEDQMLFDFAKRNYR